MLAKTNPKITLTQHTDAVCEGVRTVLDACGLSMLQFFGLDQSLLERLRRICLLAALLHDLGKAGSHFQDYISGNPPNFRINPQAIRHEYVSLLIAEDAEFKEWLRHSELWHAVVDDPADWALVLCAIIGHHRKPTPPEPRYHPNKTTIEINLGDPGMQEVLALFHIDASPPTHKLSFQSGSGNSHAKNHVMTGLANMKAWLPDTAWALPTVDRRLMSIAKAVVICGDVLGSIAQFPNRPLFGRVLKALAGLPEKDYYEKLLKHQKDAAPKKNGVFCFRAFQEAMWHSKGPVTLLWVGCGAGKSLAAVIWAIIHAVGRRLYFCYPTMDTATEGFKANMLGEEDVDVEHSRAVLDREKLNLTNAFFWTDADDEQGQSDESWAEKEDTPEARRCRREADAVFALELLHQRAVSCTVDTVLGLLGNQRRGIYSFPAISQGSFVFDEIHSYDPTLWLALLLFLEFTRVPVLLMTGTLPKERLEELQAVMTKRGEKLEIIPGDQQHEKILRYHRLDECDPWDLATQYLKADKKVLWIVNKVDKAIDLYDEAIGRGIENVTCLHSHFRPDDRRINKEKIMNSFKQNNTKGAFAITTQVTEMSLNISADFIITEIAPIEALVQRLGRLARFIEDGDEPGKFMVIDVAPDQSTRPYEQERIDVARNWLAALPKRTLSQNDLREVWENGFPFATENGINDFPWLRHHVDSSPEPVRKIDIPKYNVLEGGYNYTKCSRKDLERMSFTMLPPPSKELPRCTFYRYFLIAPPSLVSYNSERGGKWITK